jgi:hypothetical protein
MTSRSFVALLALFAIVFLPLTAVAETPEGEAVKAAEAWLALVDSGDYSKSWDAAAAYFRGAVTKEKWEEMLKGVRPPLGKVLSRKVKSKEYATSLPGAPDGEYVVIQFETSFENKNDAVETVTPMKDEDGKWRVSGYFIR